MSDVSDVTDTTDAADLELGPTGGFAHPRYINDMNPSTRFHPSELPANVDAMRNFPRHLIDPNQVTESPYGDSSVDRRLESSLSSWRDRAGQILSEEWGRITGHSAGSATPVNTAQDLGPTGVPGGVAAVGDVPLAGAVPPAEPDASAQADPGRQRALGLMQFLRDRAGIQAAGDGAPAT